MEPSPNEIPHKDFHVGVGVGLDDRFAPGAVNSTPPNAIGLFMGPYCKLDSSTSEASRDRNRREGPPNPYGKGRIPGTAHNRATPV